ncbi:MAG: 16S rRNA (guanine(966)-N(2))-methyltransferase RsmD [Desulfosudaceae bacterium]
MSLKVIGGRLKGRKLASPRGRTVRPTAGKVREAMFNIIGPAAKEAVALDLFAGAGALGIEALSRGAARAVFIDNSREALSIIHRNIATCGLADQAVVLARDATRDLGLPLAADLCADLVFLDPPYRAGLAGRALAALEKSSALSGETLVIVEHGIREPLEGLPGRFAVTDRRKYGDTLVSFLRYVIK